MKLANIKAFARIAKQTIVKYSPEILMCMGGATFVATVVVACKETVKEQELLEDHEAALDYVDLMNEEGEIDDKAWKVSRRNVYIDTIKKTTINYAPATVLGATSLACFFGAFGIMKKRYATLVMAYTALEESFRKYRQRVIETRGSDEDIYYLTGAKPKEITQKNEDGTKTKIKQLVLPDGTIASPYAFKFGKYKEDGSLNKQWSEEQSMNFAYLLGQQDYLNRMLYTRCVFDDDHKVLIRGSVLLNEIRDLCGEEPTPTGAVAGNLFGNGEPGRNGFIDFQLVGATEKDPLTGKDIPCIFVNPNCDGMIYDLLGKYEKIPFEPSYGPWGEDVSI